MRKVDNKEKTPFAYPKEIQDLIRLILLKKMNGEIQEDEENVSGEEFCLAMKLPKV